MLLGLDDFIITNKFTLNMEHLQKEFTPELLFLASGVRADIIEETELKEALANADTEFGYKMPKQYSDILSIVSSGQEVSEMDSNYLATCEYLAQVQHEVFLVVKRVHRLLEETGF